MTETENPFLHPASVLAFAVFRVHGSVIGFGDTLMRPLGLSSARWQVLGAIEDAQGALPVAGLARNMGLVRQSVQRVVDDLMEDGSVTTANNPHHRRARLVQLTSRGRTLLDEANSRWMVFAEALAAEFSGDALTRTSALLIAVRDRLDAHRLAGFEDDPHPEGEDHGSIL